MKTTKTASKPETFKTLCKELGQRIRAGFTENALLCFRAFEAYVAEHPETAHGKAKGKGEMDRTPSFRKAAAEVSGVSPSTIDALLQVGKAIHRLPKTVQHALVSSSLTNSMRVLRKLATSKFERTRETLITSFAKQEKTDPEGAMSALKKKLGISSTAKSTKKSKPHAVSQPAIQSGQSFEVAVDGQVFRVKGEIVDGQLQLTPMDEDQANAPESKRALKPAKKNLKQVA